MSGGTYSSKESKAYKKRVDLFSTSLSSSSPPSKAANDENNYIKLPAKGKWMQLNVPGCFSGIFATYPFKHYNNSVNKHKERFQ